MRKSGRRNEDSIAGNGGRTRNKIIMDQYRITRLLERLEPPGTEPGDPDPPSMIAAGSRVLYWNHEAAVRFQKVFQQAAGGVSLDRLVHEDERARFADFIALVQRGDVATQMDSWFRLSPHLELAVASEVLIIATRVDIEGISAVRLQVEHSADKGSKPNGQPSSGSIVAVESTAIQDRFDAFELLEFLNLPAMLISTEGVIKSANRNLCDLTGLDRDALEGSALSAILCDVEGASRIKNALIGGRTSGLEIPLKITDGEIRIVEVSVQPFPRNSIFAEKLVLLHDITELKRKKIEFMDAAETRREELCRRLHDDLGFDLMSLKYGAEHLSRMTRHSPEELDAKVAELQVHLDAIITKFRTINKSAEPLIDDSAVLKIALQELCVRVEEMGVAHCSFSFRSPDPPLDPGQACHVFHIAQEAMMNAVKHAGARHLSLSVAESNGRPSLAIENDGKPFPESKSASPGLGLQIMRQRAELLGAELTIRTGPAGGTLVECVLGRV